MEEASTSSNLSSLLHSSFSYSSSIRSIIHEPSIASSQDTPIAASLASLVVYLHLLTALLIVTIWHYPLSTRWIPQGSTVERELHGKGMVCAVRRPLRLTSSPVAFNRYDLEIGSRVSKRSVLTHYRTERSICARRVLLDTTAFQHQFCRSLVECVV